MNKSGYNILDVSNDTNLLVDELKARYDKYMKLQRRNNMLKLINIGCICLLIFWMQRLSSLAQNNVIDLFNYISSSKPSIFFIIVVVSSLMYSNTVSKDLKKHKTSFEELRKEVIERLKTDWVQTDKSRIKDAISEHLSNEGINIRYIN